MHVCVYVCVYVCVCVCVCIRMCIGYGCVGTRMVALACPGRVVKESKILLRAQRAVQLSSTTPDGKLALHLVTVSCQIGVAPTSNPEEAESAPIWMLWRQPQLVDELLTSNRISSVPMIMSAYAGARERKITANAVCPSIMEFLGLSLWTCSAS